MTGHTDETDQGQTAYPQNDTCEGIARSQNTVRKETPLLMTAHKITIKVDAVGHGTFEVDGVDLSSAIRGFTVQVQPQRRASVEIDLDAREIEITGLADPYRTFHVVMADGVADALTALGWTPPADDRRTYTVARLEYVSVGLEGPGSAQTWRTVPRDPRCACQPPHDPFMMRGHLPECPLYELDNASPDAND